MLHLQLTMLQVRAGGALAEDELKGGCWGGRRGEWGRMGEGGRMSEGGRMGEGNYCSMLMPDPMLTLRSCYVFTFAPLLMVCSAVSIQ